MCFTSIHTLIYVKCNWFQVCCVNLLIFILFYFYVSNDVCFYIYFNFSSSSSKHQIYLDLLYRPVSKSSNHLFVTIVMCVFSFFPLKIVFYFFFFFIFCLFVTVRLIIIIIIIYRILSFGKVSLFYLFFFLSIIILVINSLFFSF